MSLVSIVTGIRAALGLLNVIERRLAAGHQDFESETIGNETLRENLERRAEAEAAVATDPTQPTPTTDPES